MPTTQSLPTPDLYFTSLQELDNYQANALTERPSRNRTIPWTPRKTLIQGSRGKLLVCHDYKGGYVENPQALSYTFNYWSLCDSFIYFSHHRVTIPPPGWVNAAHRQGVKMFGVLIFEGGAEAECLRLIVGQLPQATTGPATQPLVPFTVPISPHYAIALAELAAERGFDGYLLNFECPLQGNFEEARALAAWITLLQSELIERVGPHAEAVWYDSVTFTGSLSWQNRLNSYNLPFFVPSTSFFSNYSWDPTYCEKSASYFLSVDPNILGLATDSKPKTLQNVYMGVDVWGRGSHGNGGFGCYKALDHIAPATLGLSVALFGPAWTWESEENDTDFSWTKWWQYERDLWVGNPDAMAAMPVPDVDTGDQHGPFQPFSAYFPHIPPPDPIDIPFHTTFCPGVGLSWFVEGTRVFRLANGWIDIDKQTTMGDLLWPIPSLSWEAEIAGTVPDVAVSCNMDESWNSGSSVQLTFTEEQASPHVTHRSFYVPIQTLSITAQKHYTASIVYKVTQLADDIDLEVSLTVRPRDTGFTPEVKVGSKSIKTTKIPNSWTQATIQFVITSIPPSTISVDSEIGLKIIARPNNASPPFALTILLGQMNIHATRATTTDPNYPRILWVDFTSTSIVIPPSVPELSAPSRIKEINKELTRITWAPATSLSQIGPVTITSPEDPACAWAPEPPLSKQWFPGFLYYNIYVANPGIAFPALIESLRIGHHEPKFRDAPTDMAWIGTSGADGAIGKGKLEFTFDRTQIPAGLRESTTVRVFVQGVLENGEVQNWQSAAYVDIEYPKKI